MLEKKRQAELRQKDPDQRRSSLRNDTPTAFSNWTQKIKNKASPIATYTNFITRPTTRAKGTLNHVQNRKKNSVHRLAEHSAMAFSL